MTSRIARNADVWPARLVGQHVLRPWLQAPGSLTARLRKRYAQFSVSLILEEWRIGQPEVLKLLGLPPRTRVWVREVCLYGNGVPRVFAHSVIVPAALRGAWHGLRSIGQRPLGEVLFNTPAAQRGKLHYRKLPLRHLLRQTVIHEGWATALQPLWARRSQFMLGRQIVLVTEVFLPGCGHREG